ncbi:hypothetical protein Esi_0136_0047 [Ectocarpus siliculosus]|uniref:Nucleoporin Nup54 alpha-helical domain-containing protein n=1 Tax=Ectocarpus siliculosus TaxID=2880 RepID=D7FJS3_ECTSI|nr:hypothetical protein Esi_0136_0047 [Ectocarpus siliculosus]|eukprot:CBJ29175.1 hypothetical protein Esi_0136_0047 [Ectocarpus siliculosus]
MSFFGAPAPAPAAGGFSFGAASTPAPAAAPGGFSFGAKASAPAAPGTTGLFGTAAAAPAPATTPAFGSAFGATPAPAPSAFGGAFGTTTPAPAPSAFGSAFGGTPAPAPASAFGGAFGTAPAAAAPAPSSSIFGFGAPAAAAPGASSVFGAPATAAAAAGAPQGITPETRYDQLPEVVRKQIDQLAEEIKRQRGVADEVSRTNPTDGLAVQAQIRELRRDLLDLGNEQGTQKLAMKDLKADAGKTSRQAEEIHAMQVQLSEEPLQGGEATAPYGQRARVTPGRLAFVIREQMKTFNQRCRIRCA